MTLFVFSHPNHELAVFGLLQRLRPHLVYLTDGGGQEREAETRHGLERIGLLKNACFLNHPEAAFYEAFLACDSNFFEKVVDEVRIAIQTLGPKVIFCDAIEFYNPVHDISLPILRAALNGLISAPLFEVPLIHQKSVGHEAYDIQRMPPSRRSGQLKFCLSTQELTTKITARDQIYTILLNQLGLLISELPPTHLAVEVVAPASPSLPEPNAEIVLRYERRARLLRQRGKIEHEITWRRHYLPVASSLVNRDRGGAAASDATESNQNVGEGKVASAAKSEAWSSFSVL